VSALIPYERSELVRRRHRRQNGATNVLQLASAGIAADVRIERVDRRNARAWYALRLGAGTSDVTARLLGRLRGGVVEELGSMLAPAGSIGSASFAVTTPRTGAYESIVLEIRSGEMLLHVDASLPPRPPRSRLFVSAGILGVAGFVLLAGAAVPFAFGAVERGTSRPIPAAAVSPIPVAVKVPPAAAARVQSFSARRDQMPGGRETVLASYLAVGERGSVALLDGDGSVVATAPFAHAGTIRLPVPSAYRALPLTAQLTVRGGGAKAVSSVLVGPNAIATAAPVTPAPSASPSTASAPAGDSAQTANTGLLTVVGRAVAGTPLNLRLAAQRTRVRIELEDEAGTTIAETDVPAGGTHATLPIPPSSERATYLVALHYTRGGGEELLIRTVVALPH
jgi:hypothetical protein